MSKEVTTQPLVLTNPWETRDRAPVLRKAASFHGEVHIADRADHADDHFGTEPFPAETHQRLSKLTPKELHNAFKIHLLNGHDRREIFRHRLATQFPQAAHAVQGMKLDANHDYTKVLEFMDTGRWPRSTPETVLRSYPRLLGELLAPLESAYKKQAVNEAVEHAKASGTEPDAAFATHVEHAATAVCEAIRNAHLQGETKLHLPGDAALRTLPQHLAALLKPMKLLHVGKANVERPAWLPAHVQFLRD